MKKALLIILLLYHAPAFAQSTSHKTKVEADECTPIGQTADGKLIYSLNCKKLPAQATTADTPSQVEVPPAKSTGLFGLSFSRKGNDEPQNAPNPPSPN